jgi:hypothetical protein
LVPAWPGFPSGGDMDMISTVPSSPSYTFRRITMKKSVLALTVSCALAGLTNSANAADVGLTLDAGTTGAGLHLVFALPMDLNARVGANALNFNYSRSSSQSDYDFGLKLQTIDALVDWFPTKGSGFRFTTGLVFNGSKMDYNMKVNAGNQYVLNGNTYAISQVGSIHGAVEYKKVAPYLGIGWSNLPTSGKGWGFTADMGLMFQGNPDSTLVNSSCTAAAVVCAQLASDLAAEKANLDDLLNNFKTYPVLRMGASYAF